MAAVIYSPSERAVNAAAASAAAVGDEASSLEQHPLASRNHSVNLAGTTDDMGNLMEVGDELTAERLVSRDHHKTFVCVVCV